MSLPVSEQDNQIDFMTKWCAKETLKAPTLHDLDQKVRHNVQSLAIKQMKTVAQVQHTFTTAIHGPSAKAQYQRVEQESLVLQQAQGQLTQEANELKERLAVSKERLAQVTQINDEKKQELKVLQENVKHIRTNPERMW